MSDWVKPTPAEFKAFFNRDFNYAPASDPNNLGFVTDADITKAIGMALLNFSPGLFGTNENTTTVFMWLAAFYLVQNLQTSAQGVGSKSNFPINSKSVGGVAVSYTIPEKYTKNPWLSALTANGYGMTYLSLALPYTVGNVKIAFGTTTAS